MQKQMPAYTNIIYYIIIVLVLMTAIWAYYQPVEVTIQGQGEVCLLGDAQAICPYENAIVQKIWTKQSGEVKQGQSILNYYQLKGDGTILPKEEVIYSPVDGFLMWQKELFKGDLIQAGERLAIVYPSSQLSIKTYLSEQNLGMVMTDMPVRIILDAYPHQNFGTLMGKVTNFAIERDAKELKVVVFIAIEEIPDKRMNLLPGLNAKVEIIVGKERLLNRLLF